MVNAHPYPRTRRAPSRAALTMLAAWAMPSLFGLLLTAGSAAAAARPIVMGDFSWDSAQLHNRIAGFIIEHGFGIPVQYQFGDTMPVLLGLRRGDIDATTELWPDNIRDAYSDALQSGDVIDLGPNYPDSPQGWYVPTYLITGDPARGISPAAPDLKSVRDLPRYWQLFRDPEVPDKGRLYNCPSGWRCADINAAKLKAYGLDRYFTAFDPGSETALATAVVRAYERGEPILAYHWEPTWVLGLYDMTRLEEPPYSDACWTSDFGCAYPPSRVQVAVNAGLVRRAPQVVTFLANYDTTLEQTNAALAYMHRTGASVDEAAIWFLRMYPEQWRRWIPVGPMGDQVARRVEAALSRLPEGR